MSSPLISWRYTSLLAASPYKRQQKKRPYANSDHLLLLEVSLRRIPAEDAQILANELVLSYQQGVPKYIYLSQA